MRDFPDPSNGSERLPETFKKGATLVASAILALEAMPSSLADIRSRLAGTPSRSLLPSIAGLFRLVQDAKVGDDNLLVAPRNGADRAFILPVVGRQPSGAVDVRTLEIDRDALALVGRDHESERRPLDLLADAARIAQSEPSDGARAMAVAALDHLGNRVAIGSSRLSLVKARLDLQESFLASVISDPAASRAQIDSNLDQASARDLAQAARRLLTKRSLTIAAGNRAVLASLLRADPERAR